MSNKKRSAAIQHHPEHGMAAQLHEERNNDPLPDEEKILKLHAIDPEILPWLKKSYEQEQKNKHEYRMEKLKAKGELDKDDRRDRSHGRVFRWVAMLSSVSLLIGSCLLGGYLIYLEKPQGAAVLGVPVMLVIGGLVTATMRERRRKKSSDTAPPPAH